MAATATAPLVVKCPGGEKRDSTRVVSGIVNLFAEYLAERGLGGTWKLELFKKTGGGGQDRISYKRAYQETAAAPECHLYNIRPHDRDSSWAVLVYPPPDTDIPALIATVPIIVSNEDEDAEESTMEESPMAVFDSHVYHAKVVAHRNHGIDIEIDEQGRKVPGVIELADLCIGGGYNKKEMNKFPVGRGVKVLVCDASQSPVVCSIRTDTVLSTSSSKDVFTGALKDGELPLAGFTYDHRRIYALVEYLGLITLEKGSFCLPREVAIDSCIAHLKAVYGAKSVARQRVCVVLDACCKARGALPEPLLKKTDEGYLLTDFALRELGLQDAAEKQLEQPSPQASFEDLEGVDIPPVMPQEPPTQSVEAIAEYLSKAIRRADIQLSLDNLSREKQELDAWLKANQDCREAAQEVIKRTKAT
jgi:hypothetical protein